MILPFENMRILFCRSNPVAPDPRVEKEAEALAEAGYSVSAIAWDQTASLPTVDRTGNLEIERIHLRVKNARGLGNLPYILVWQVLLLHRLITNRNSYHIIHACDFDTILPALIMKILWGKIIIYDIFDFYGDMLRLTPQPIVNLLRRIELWAINQTDAIILPDESRYKQIEGSHPKRSIVIYNSPQEISINSSEDGSETTSGSFQLVYVGNLQIQRGLLTILNILDRHPDWKFDLAGFGPDETIILEKAATMKNVSWHGRVNYEQALRLNNKADVLVALYDPAVPNHRYASPNKLFESMMLGKPAVVAQGTNIDAVVNRIECGLVVDYDDEDSLESALKYLKENPKIRFKMGLHARNAYETTYSWSQMKSRLLNLYEEIVS